MKSEPLTVNQLFQNRRQYCVPFYQRAYVWTLRDQWSALLEDIIDKAESRLSKTKPTP
ncbi:GmrSD restriction endonuclease domain-containing protein, partial [Klebsiella pneumoniae]